MASYDNWKTTDVAFDLASADAELLDGIHARIDNGIAMAIGKVNSQDIGLVSAETEVYGDADESLSMDVTLRLGCIRIGDNGEFARESIAEMLESLADEIRRAGQRGIAHTQWRILSTD